MVHHNQAIDNYGAMVDKFIQSIWKDYKPLAGVITVLVVGFTFFIFDSPSAAKLDSFWALFIYKAAVALLVSFYFLGILPLIHLCLLSPLRAPMAMAQIAGEQVLEQFHGAFRHTLIAFFAKLWHGLLEQFQVVRVVVTDPFKQVDRYTLNTVPYRLYPLSCTLLE